MKLIGAMMKTMFSPIIMFIELINFEKITKYFNRKSYFIYLLAIAFTVVLAYFVYFY